MGARRAWRLAVRCVSDPRRPKKPAWAVARDREKAAGPESIWLFGLHAVRDALENPARDKRRLIVTRNAADRLGPAIEASGLEPEIADARRFPAPLDPQSVHQGAALEALPLEWGGVQEVCKPHPRDPAPLVLVLDRVTDPHNVGAMLRSAEVFGARAVIAPRHHSAPEGGALAKAASGALERQPYVRVRNLADTMESLTAMGYWLIGMDGDAETSLQSALATRPAGPSGIVMGAEGPGLRQRTRETCSTLARINPAGEFGSLNVSNAAAVGLFALHQDRTK